VAAYVIYQVEVLDPDQYARYIALSGPAVAAGGGEFIARGGETDALEGTAPVGRTVVVRFESMEAARAWYDSEQYQAAKQLREGAAKANAYIVDGVE
jgi:uncharacterized protein (DUF1330 family)